MSAFGISATINSFLKGGKFKVAIYIPRPEVEYNPENEILRDQVTRVFTR